MDKTQPSGLIPHQLLAEIKKGDCVLFLGADLPLGYEDAPLSRPELATTLAEKFDLPHHLSWSETVQLYLSQFHGDRNGLIRFVAEHNGSPPAKAGPLYAAIARIGFRVIVTAWYDDLLEQTLRSEGYRVNRVVRDTQLAYAGTGEQEIIVIKLYGCLSDPESLVLDKWDHEELMDHLNRKLDIVTAFCSLRPPLFIGFDLTDQTPIRLYVRASANLAQHMRRAYVVWPQVVAGMRAIWQHKNVEFCQAEAGAFLQTLASQLPAAVSTGKRAIRVHRPPYKFLDYYEAADADIFCGRDTESQIVTRLALSHRLLTLFGPSGAGKTSLLLAGVLPRLAAEGYRHVYVRALDDPLPALRRAVAERAGRADEPPETALRDFLHALLAPEDKLVIILDQFEEFFLRVGSRRREEFLAQLAAALTNPSREVRVIFSLREDYLPHLDEARPLLPDIFGNSYRLITLERANARVAITEPAVRAGLTVEAALVDTLVGAEGQGRKQAGDLVEKDGHVPPAALQIVLDRLYRQAMPAGHDPGDSPPPGLSLTLAAYQAITHKASDGAGARTLRGAEAILAGYVDEGLAHLARLPGADPILGEAILKVMVTSQATKAALSQAELMDGLAETGLIDAADPADRRLVERTRLGLERVRLVRSFTRDDLALYEPAHDHLAAAIARRMDAAELGAKLAREMLRREMDNWRGSGLLIRPEILALIHEQRDSLQRLKPDELELLFRSALRAGYEVSYWFERARASGVAVNDLALAGLQDDNFRTRAEAVTALGQLGKTFVDSITNMLADNYPQVRLAAIRALEKLDPSGSWRIHLKYECYVPAGEFIMGDDNGEKNEKPAHTVELTAYYCGRYLVTNADYKRYQDDLGRAFEIPKGKADHPVTSVSWYDARDYAAWAGMRLLTEAEWEKAASWEAEGQGAGEKSAGSLTHLVRRLASGTSPKRKRIYPWGNEFDKNRCNTHETGIGDTTPVGKFSPAGDSPCGAADMSGNVWEWTSSLHRAYPFRADDGREDPASSDRRVLRGGSFYFNSRDARAASRDHYGPHYRLRHLGFRVGVAAAPFSLPLASDPSGL